MATEIFARRVNDALIAADGCSQEALDDLKAGTVYQVKLTASRKYKFLQKAFVLVWYAFEIWEPNQEYKGQVVQKNLERFRDDLTILAGFYDLVPTLKGEVKAVAKSWSFSSMPDDEDFSKLYSGLINVVLARVLQGYSGEELDDIVNNIIHGFS